MLIKNVTIILILFSLLNVFQSQLNYFQSNLNYRSLKSFYKCVSEKTNIGNETLVIIQSLINNSSSYNKRLIQETLTNNYDKIAKCIGKGIIPKFPDGSNLIDVNLFFGNKYDWFQFLTCIMGKITNIEESPLKNLIQNINKGNYYNALREEFKLRNNGNSIIMECMPKKIKSIFYKTEQNFNKTKKVEVNKYNTKFDISKVK